MRVQNILIRILDIIGSLLGLLVSVVPVILIAIQVKKDGGHTVRQEFDIDQEFNFAHDQVK
ncbi:hypothetical protein NE281_07300 [Leuconostoc mesenteroides]|uniref:hypothetical protein n=1 Tax=Leuconostoc mesenteroides TaxID=1245 RepID=UPI0020738862|nr:hypothetical protein [Leuconostoc mesenteroides]MCM6837921.1 hypothetical protein [Leuconostoc mesenteroides]